MKNRTASDRCFSLGSVLLLLHLPWKDGTDDYAQTNSQLLLILWNGDTPFHCSASKMMSIRKECVIHAKYSCRVYCTQPGMISQAFLSLKEKKDG